MVEWIDYSQNTPLSKVRQEHSAIKDSGELLNAVLAVGGAGHFPPDTYNAMLSPLHQLTLVFLFFCRVTFLIIFAHTNVRVR